MMQNAEPPPAAPSIKQRIDQTKLTPLVIVAFFGALALMSGAAAVVGYAAHRMSHPGAHAKGS